MAGTVTWTKEQVSLLCKLYHNHTNAEISLIVGHTSEAVRYKAKTLGLKKDNEWLLSKCSKTTFKKGNIPANKVEIGHERKDVDGYWLVKVAEPNVFKHKHRVLWEQHYGPIPKGSVVSFIDGNPDNICIENLRMETKKDKFFRCACLHTTLPPEIRELVLLKGKLKRQINKLENKENGKKDRNKRNRKTETDEGPTMGL